MQLKMYQVDAFAEQVFEGNPAAVVPLEEWLPDETMLALAAENNLSETVFFKPIEDGFYIRWFTPVAEVDLCGHATLASAWVIFNILGYGKPLIRFASLSGPLIVQREEERLLMDFPSQPPVTCEDDEVCRLLGEALGARPSEVLEREDYIAVFRSEDQLREIRPDMALLQGLGLRGVAVTSPAQDYDFVARFFAPKYGIAEDPVTGSAYTQLAPYWAGRLDKNALNARQISARGGNIMCRVEGERVILGGTAVQYMQADIYLPGK